MKFESNPPEAASLMMSARSFGNYDLPGAIADLIDNSIKARAKRIRIWCRYNAGEPEVRICDDGDGMSQGELIAAMRPASSNPTEKRASDDLGRFGWGMKSASFSQCRRLTVLTVQKGMRSGASWDLDDIQDWRMGVLSHDEVADASEGLHSLKNGTETAVEHREDPRLTVLLDRDTPARAKTIAYNMRNGVWQPRQLSQALARVLARLARQGEVRRGLTWHGLRHTRGVELAESGCSDAIIMAQLGHTTDRSAQIYRRQASRRRLGDVGQALVDAHCAGETRSVSHVLANRGG